VLKAGCGLGRPKRCGDMVMREGRGGAGGAVGGRKIEGVMRDRTIPRISNRSVTEMKRFEQRVKKLNMYDRSIIQPPRLSC